MALKSRKKATFDNPAPDTALFQVQKLEFDRNDEGVIATGNVKIVESINVADNVDKSMPLYYRLYEKDGKAFSAELFIGLIECCTGKEVVAEDCSIFEDVKFQDKIQNALPDALFGGTIVENTYKNKETGKMVENVQIGEYLTTEEFKEASRSASGNGKAKATATAPDNATDSGKFF